MTEIIQETITTEGASANTDKIMTTPVKSGATKSETSEYLIYYVFGALEILLAFRLILKFMGASVSSAFVGFIYGLSGIFIMPFEGIFRRGVSEGLETSSILEPATLVAIVVYALAGWGVVKLVRIFSGEQQAS